MPKSPSHTIFTWTRAVEQPACSSVVVWGGEIGITKAHPPRPWIVRYTDYGVKQVITQHLTIRIVKFLL